MSTATVYFHNKFRVLHDVFLLLFYAEGPLGDRQQPALYERTGVTLTALRDIPHSKQHAFKRDVINPHDGHIVCDPNPANCGFSLRIL